MRKLDPVMVAAVVTVGRQFGPGFYSSGSFERYTNTTLGYKIVSVRRQLSFSMLNTKKVRQITLFANGITEIL